jgi:hypothetical protein
VPRFASSSATIIQIVGTPAVIVTSSLISRSTTVTGSRCAPAKTCLAPTVVEAKGMPHALAWNIGTIGNVQSLGPIESPAPELAMSVWR